MAAFKPCTIAIIALTFALLCLTSSVYAQTGGVTLNFNISWDSTLYSTPSELEQALKSTLVTCEVADRPRYSRLLAGANVLTPRFFVRVPTTSTSASYLSNCHNLIIAKFPTMATTPNAGSNDGCFNQSTNPSETGFLSGTAGCEALFKATCSLQTICGTGTSCSGNPGQCVIVPRVFPFDFKINTEIKVEETTPGEARRAIDFITTVRAHVTTVLASTECEGLYRTSELISKADSSGNIIPDIVTLILAADIEPVQACRDVITTFTADVPLTDNSIASISYNASPPKINIACYTTNLNGFITNFNIGGSCPLSRPLGHECTGSFNQAGVQVCPDPNSTCDAYPLDPAIGGDSFRDVCVLHNAQTYFDNWHVHVMRYESAFLGSPVANFVNHFLVQAATPECTDVVRPGSGSIAAVPGSIVKFDYYFISPLAAIPSACEIMLTSITSSATQPIKSVTYSPLDTSTAYPPFSCFTTSSGGNIATPVYALLRVMPGGRCTWKRALGISCNADLDCDVTSSTACSRGTGAQGTICTRPGLIPDPTNVVMARIDVDASAFLGSKYGKERLNLYVEKLEALCEFDKHIFNIGNGNFSKAQIWLTPFDYSACTQTMVQTAALQANKVSVSENIAPFFTMSSSIPTDDLDFALTAKLVPLNEEGAEEEPEPEPEPEPVDPSSIIPKLTYASIKTFTKTLPLTCRDAAGDIMCSAQDPQCDIPCEYGHACTTNTHCGSFGTCSGGTCIQRGSQYLPPVKGNASAISVFVAVAIVTVGLMF